jgi:hypothetical protein
MRIATGIAGYGTAAGVRVMSADYKSEQAAPESGFINYGIAFSMAHTPHGQIPAQIPQPMQYLSSETYS